MNRGRLPQRAAAILVFSLVVVLQGAVGAYADPTLIAIGSISGTYEDQAIETAAPLENGVPGNRLGGMGSALAYAGGNIFLALPDRGPNAKMYNSAVDDTTSYIVRFQTLSLSLAPSDPGSPLPFVLTPMLLDTTLLSSSSPLVYGNGGAAGLPGGAPALNATDHTHYFTGRSDNFDPTTLSTNPANARLDPEGIRVSNNGRRVYISDEYGPYVYEFNRKTGRRERSFSIPDNLAVAILSAHGDTEISANTSGRVANKGMEGLAITPDGKTLVGIMQAPLIQDGGKIIRIVTFDIANGKTHQYAYALTTGTGVSEILAVNDHEFLMDERDGKGQGDGSAAVVKQLFKIDLTGATDVSKVSGAANLAPLAVPKTLFLDVVKALTGAGISTIHIPAKLEGMAFGQDVVLNGVPKHTLYIANDNDFLASVADKNNVMVDNPNQYFVFAFSDTDVPGFVPQRFTGDHVDEDDDR
jgi:Esterase-like activity of phytase